MTKRIHTRLLLYFFLNLRGYIGQRFATVYHGITYRKFSNFRRCIELIDGQLAINRLSYRTTLWMNYLVYKITITTVMVLILSFYQDCHLSRLYCLVSFDLMVRRKASNLANWNLRHLMCCHTVEEVRYLSFPSTLSRIIVTLAGLLFYSNLSLEIQPLQ